MVQNLQMPGADVLLYPSFFSSKAAGLYFKKLAKTTNWQRLTMGTPGGRVPLPRLVAWYGDPGVTYTYSGITHDPLEWTDLLIEIKSKIEPITQTKFNTVLLNYYRDGRDSVGWHSDDEPELGKEPVIASVSFGATREFQFQHKHGSQPKESVELTHGSLLIMRGATQQNWLHRIPKTTEPVGARINLTFRYTHPKGN